MNRSIIVLLSGIVGLLTAIVTNLDRVEDFIDNLRGTGGLRVEGQWVGVFRDINADLGKEFVTSEIHELEQRGRVIRGKIHTSNSINRSWITRGKLHTEWTDISKGPFLILNYEGPSGRNVPLSLQRASVGSLILKLVNSSDNSVVEFQGYWMGHDPDLGRIVSCPYILSSDKSDDIVKQRFEKWLDQSCAY